MRKAVQLAVFILSILMMASYSYAGKVTTVLGIIEGVNDGSIEVRGRYYDVSKAELVGTAGNKLTKDFLKTGRKVRIFFEDGTLTSVVIYEYVTE